MALLGDEDSGKSTLIGVLFTGSLDNGAGMKRLEVCRHVHEIEHGRTSSISQQILGAPACSVAVVVCQLAASGWCASASNYAFSCACLVVPFWHPLP